MTKSGPVPSDKDKDDGLPPAAPPVEAPQPAGPPPHPPPSDQKRRDRLGLP